MNRNDIILFLILVLIVLYLIDYKKENFDDTHYYDLPFDERPKKKINDTNNKSIFRIIYDKLTKLYNVDEEQIEKIKKKDINRMVNPKTNYNYNNTPKIDYEENVNDKFYKLETMQNTELNEKFLYETLPESTNNPNEKLNHPAAFSGFYNDSQLMQNTEPSNITIEDQFNSPYTSNTDSLVTNELRYKMKHLIKAGVFKDYEHQDRTESLQAAEEYMAYQQLQDNMRDLRTGNVKDGTLRETYNNMIYDYKK